MFYPTAQPKDHEKIVSLIDPNYIETNHLNWTALHRAMYEGDVKRVKWLIANGACLQKDTHGHYPHQISSYPTVKPADHDKIINLLQPNLPPTVSKKHHHKRHGIKKFTHKLSKAVGSVAKLTVPITRPIIEITAPITKPIFKVTAPVMQPVAKVLKPINEILEPVNSVLTPISILATGGTIETAVLATLKEQVINKITAPINDVVNHVVNPVGALMNDVAKPIAPLLSTAGNAVQIANKVEIIAKSLKLDSTNNGKKENPVSDENKKEKTDVNNDHKPVNQSINRENILQELNSTNKNNQNLTNKNLQITEDLNDTNNPSNLSQNTQILGKNNFINHHPEKMKELNYLKEGYSVVTKVTNELMEDRTLKTINNVQAGIVNSTLCIAKELSNGNDVIPTLKNCGHEQLGDTIKTITETVVSNATTKALGNVITGITPKVAGGALGIFAAEILDPPPLNSIEKVSPLKKYNPEEIEKSRIEAMKRLEDIKESGSIKFK